VQGCTYFTTTILLHYSYLHLSHISRPFDPPLFNRFIKLCCIVQSMNSIPNIVHPLFLAPSAPVSLMVKHLVSFERLPVWFYRKADYPDSLSIIVQQDATMYSLLDFCKLLYMFRVVTPPIIRRSYNCNHSIWHCSNSFCYCPHSGQWQASTRCCDYSYKCSWCWVELPPETCRAIYRNIINSI
jgi:hypothetical protein